MTNTFGVNVTTSTSVTTGGTAPDSGTLHLAGKVLAGSTTAVTICRNIGEWVSAYGSRSVGGPEAYDYLDTFFQEGGTRCVFAGYTTDYTLALALLNDPSQGPGQLGLSGTAVSSGVFTNLQTVAKATNRVVLRDVLAADTTDAALDATAAWAPANDDYGATFGPWVTVPPPNGVIGGSARSVPYSAVIAGLCARVDQNGNPNAAAAGLDYPFLFVSSFVDVNDTDRDALFSAGVNCPHNIAGTNQNYGFQTNLDQTSTSNPFWQFNCSRARMYLQAQCRYRAQPYVFKSIDGKGKLLARLAGDLSSECKALYDANGLYGATAEDAYSIVVSAALNPDTSIAQGTIHAAASVVFSMHTKRINIDLVTVPIGSPVG
jgi:hypothetical protein